MVAHKGTLAVVILWEEEVRAAAKACVAFNAVHRARIKMSAEERETDTDGENDYWRLLSETLAHSFTALSGAEDDDSHLLMTRYEPIVKKTKKVGREVVSEKT